MEALPHLPHGAAFAERLTPARRAQLRTALTDIKERAKTLNDLIGGAAFLFAQRPLALDEAASALVDAEARTLLGELGSVLASVEDWRVVPLEAAVKSFAGGKGLKLGKVAQPLRAALTGRAASPGIFEVLAVLGREESLARIADQSRR